MYLLPACTINSQSYSTILTTNKLGLAFHSLSPLVLNVSILSQQVTRKLFISSVTQITSPLASSITSSLSFYHHTSLDPSTIVLNDIISTINNICQPM